MLRAHDSELPSDDVAVGGPAISTPVSLQGRRAAVGPSSGRTRPGRPYVALTDWDSDFLKAVQPDEQRQARRALCAYSFDLNRGKVSLSSVGLPTTTFAVVVLAGALRQQTQAAAGQFSAFIFPGDVLMPFDAEPGGLSGGVTLTVTERVCLAALDQRFIRAAAIWPQLMAVVQRRIAEQLHRVAVHGAILQLPHVDERLLALLRHLADHSGTVTAEGIVVNRTLNHQDLAELVAARRPTVSLALKRLRDEGSLGRSEDGKWVLKHRR